MISKEEWKELKEKEKRRRKLKQGKLSEEDKNRRIYEEEMLNLERQGD